MSPRLAASTSVRTGLGSVGSSALTGSSRPSSRGPARIELPFWSDIRYGRAYRMHDYGFFSYDSKADFIERSKTSWNPDKTQFWQDAGVDLVIDRRDGYLFWDMEGRRLIDLHLNGGTYNLGHRNRELIATLEQAMEHFDIGNHHFPALARTALAEELVRTATPQHAPRDLRLGRRRGDRHRDQDRAPHAAAPQDRLDREGLPRPHRPRRRGRRPALLRAVPGRPARRVRAGPVQRPAGDGGRAARPRRRRGADGVDPRDLRLPAARARLPRRGQAAVRELRRALHRRRGADRA